MLYYLSSALVTAIAVGVLGYGMSTAWARTSMRCTDKTNDTLTGTAVVTLELFDGKLERVVCPFSGPPDDFQGNFLNWIPMSEIYLSIYL